MRKPVTVLVIVLVLAALSGGGVYLVKARRAPAPGAATATPVEVVRGDVESVVTAQGTLEPKNYVDVGAQVSGLIEKMHVDIGDTVQQGDLIAEIDPEVYESQVRGDEARLKTLTAQKNQQEALVKQAELKNTRNQNLLKDKAISREAADDTQTALAVAEAQRASLEAQIEEAQSTLEGDKANLGYTKIYAPMPGVVVSQSVKEGQTINANQTAPVIVQVADLDTMTVRAKVAEADVMKITPGMAVYFTTLGSGARRWNATVRQVEPSPEIVNDVVLYNVLADVDNADGRLMSGMTTQMFFVVGRAQDAPTVPAAALNRRAPDFDTDAGQAYIVKKIVNGQPQDTTVIVGVADRSRAAVVSGLAPGDRILLPAAVPAAAGGGNSSRGGMRMMGRL
jgi:macrolide-specific efflux system membrane fusion protein